MFGTKNGLAGVCRVLSVLVLLVLSCGLVWLAYASYADRHALFFDASERIDRAVAMQSCMDARAVDVDADGDLDLVLSMEREPNRVLLNDGRAKFAALAESHLPQPHARDTEMAAVFDANADGLLDIVFVSEDDETNEYLWQMPGDGTPRFVVAPVTLPVRGRSNAVVAVDIDGDGDLDLVIGNDGPNFALLNDGQGSFFDESRARLGERADTTQDIAVGDVDADGDVDLVLGNEGENRLLRNDGSGHFTDEALSQKEGSAAHMRETRDVDLVDLNADGRLDLVVSNVRLRTKNARNQLLLGDGLGGFDERLDALPQDDAYTFDAEVLDVDGDGSKEIVFGNAPFGESFVERALAHFVTNHVVALRRVTAEARPSERRPSERLRFVEASREVLGSRVSGATFDLAQGDFNGDGRLDLYVCNRGHNGRDNKDVLLLRRE